MKFGHYLVDVNNVSEHVKVKFMGKAIMSHEHKHVRNCGKQVWHWGLYRGWEYSPNFGEYKAAEKPKIIQLMELTGAL